MRKENVYVLLGWSNLTGESTHVSDVIEIVRKFSVENTLPVLAQCNYLLGRPTERDSMVAVLERDFLPNKINAQLQMKRRSSQYRYHCFTQQSMMLAMKTLLIAGSRTNGVDLSESDNRHSLAEVILRCSDLIHSNTSQDYDPETPLLAKPSRFAMSTHARGIIAQNLSFDRIVSRNHRLFGDHLWKGLAKVNRRLPELILARFYAAHNADLRTVQQLSIVIGTLLEPITTKTFGSSTSAIDVGEASKALNRSEEEVQALLSVIGVPIEDAANVILNPPSQSLYWDYSCIAKKPLITSDTRLIGLDRNFVLRLSGQWILQVLQDVLGNTWNRFCTGFGYAFEDYVQELLDNNLNTDDYSHCRIEGERKIPDFKITNGPAEIVIEVTGALNLDSALLDMDPQNYVNQVARLQKKCCQLAAYLKSPDYNPEPSVKRVFPVILTYADGGTSYGASEVLRPYLKAELESCKDVERNALIRPLTVMSIDDWEQLMYLSYNGICLRDAFDAYMADEPIGRDSISTVMGNRKYQAPTTPPYFTDTVKHALDHARKLLSSP